ncbi:unnamed protein product [Leptosia nina]|uniref:Carboxylic ester hydrolase n=1 Tax=Leptosia nina TaxID=320188 RepID=A0AAV1K0E7_9NEOP
MWALALLLVGAARGQLRLDPLVDTKVGLIKGLRADDGDYSMFLGVPYGKVDAANAFGAAAPYPKFESPFEAYDDSNICPQIEEFSKEIRGNLDCLRLNIYVPNVATTRNKLPVLVWIHGGGFQYGSGAKYAAGPRFIVRHDIILVSINYRLGPYGFMCLDLPEVSGNQGLKDQTLALRWVRDNIQEFGGDPNQVTIYGESAGAASVEFHIISKNEKLFNQAILSSGSIFGRWTVASVNNTAPSKLARQLGYDTNDLKDALAFLNQTDTKLVVAAANTVDVTLVGCVEQEFDGVEAFLTERPYGLTELPKAKGINIMSGYNSHEMMLGLPNEQVDAYVGVDPFRDFVDKVGFGEKRAAAYDFLRHFYIGDEAIGESVKWELVNFNSDTSFNHPIQKSIERFHQSGAKNIYHYVFGYSGHRNFVKVRLNITEDGAAHADELGYIFDIVVLDKPVNEQDQVVVDRMTSMWANFVKHGNPTPETTDLLPTKWPAVTTDSLNYMFIGEELKTGSRPNHERMSFWDLFYEAYKEEVLG